MMHAVRRSRRAIPRHATVRRWSGRLLVSASRWSSSTPTPNDHVGALSSPPLASLPRRGRCRPLSVGRLRPLSSAVVVAELDPLLDDDERGAWAPSSRALDADAARLDEEEKNRLVELLAAELRAEMERLIRFNEERCAVWRRRRSAEEEEDDDAPPLPDVFHQTSLSNSLRRAADARRRERGRRRRAVAEVRGGHLVVPPSANDGVVPTTTDANGASSAAWFDVASTLDATGNDRGPLVQDDNNQKTTTSIAPSTPSRLNPTTTITTNSSSSSSLLDLVESEEWRVIDDYVTQSASFGVNGHATYLEESGLVNGVDDAAARLEQTLETATLLNMLIPSWSVFRDDPTDEDEDEDEEERDEETNDHDDDHDEDDDELRPLTEDELAIVEERARRLLDGAWSLDVHEYELLAAVASLIVKDGSLLLTVLDRVDADDADVARRFAASRAPGAAACALNREGAREPAAALASRAAALLFEGVADVDSATVGAAISGAVAAGAVDATAELLATARARGHRDAALGARAAAARAFRDARDSKRALATLRACADDAADNPRTAKGARRVIRTVVQWPLLLNEVGDREDYARHMTAVMDEFDRWENEDAGLRADRSARRYLVVGLHAASRRSGDFLALVVRATREFLRRDEARRLDAEVVEIGLTAAEETRDARLAVDVLRWAVACQDRQRRSEDDHQQQHHHHHYHHHRVSTRVFLRTLRVCLDAEDLDAGREVLSSCHSDTAPDAARTRLHTLLLAGHAARGDHSAARSVLDDMRSNGPPPSTNAYAAVVHALAVADLPDEAAALVEEMRTEDGVAPNAACFAALMLSRLRTREWDEVRGVEDAMARSGVAHTAETLRGSLAASAGLGDVDRTVADLRAALDADVPLDRDAARTAARTLLGDDVDANDDDDRRRTALDRLRRRRPNASPRVDALARTLRAAEVEEARTLSRRPRTERRRTRSWRRAVEAVLDLHEVLTRDEETGDDHGDASGSG